MENTTAIILAAGMGKRMGELTKDRPKGLIEVGGKTLLQYAVEFVKKTGVEEIIVVGGYYFDKVKKEAERIDSKIKCVENNQYEMQNLISLDKPLPLVENKDLLVCNADYIFKETTAEAVADKMEGISVYCSFDLSGDDNDVMKAMSGKDGNLIGMSKQLEGFDSIYTGIFYFASRHIPELKKTAAEILEKYDNKKTTVEYLFPEFMKKGYEIKVQDVGRADWLEIDTPEELTAAEQALNNR